MTKDVFVSIKGLQFSEMNGGEELETITVGTYYRKNRHHYVLFEESVEGCEKPIQTMVKFNEEELQLTKRGLIQVQLLFQKGRKNITSYHTPFGTIMVGAETNSVIITEESDEITLAVHYGLEVNYEYLADCDITIHIRASAFI